MSKKRTFRDKIKDNLGAILFTIVIIVLFFVGIFAFNNPKPSLEDLGFKKEDVYYYKDDIKVNSYSSGNISLEQDITPQYKSHNVITIINKLTKCDLSFMEEFIDNIISTKAYLELDYLSFYSCDIGYDLNINSPSYDNENYTISQYINYKPVKQEIDDKISSFTIKLHDNYDLIAKQIINLYKNNFREEEKKVSYAFNKILGDIDVDKTDVSLVINNKKYDYSSFEKGSISIYTYSYVSTYDNHDINVKYDQEYFATNYEKLLGEDMKLLDISVDKSIVYNKIKDYLQLYETSEYRNGIEIEVDDNHRMGINSGYKSFVLWYDYL